MTRRILLSTLFLAASMHANDSGLTITKTVGATLQYTRFKQGCLPKQKGFMMGPELHAFIKKAWRPAAHIGFTGLWDIEYIASKNGLFIDANEYQLEAHLGFCFTTCNEKLEIIPFTGMDYIHLFHEVEDDIIKRKYNQINIPIGIMLKHDVCSHFEWGICALYDIDVWTRTRIITPDLCESTNLKLKRGQRVAIHAPLICKHHLNDCFDIDCVFTPLFSWQKFNVEDCCTGNPQSPLLKFWHLGATLSLAIRF